MGRDVEEVDQTEFGGECPGGVVLGEAAGERDASGFEYAVGPTHRYPGRVAVSLMLGSGVDPQLGASVVPIRRMSPR